MTFSSFYFLPFVSNQEELERVKKDIEEQKKRKKDLETEAQRTNIVLQSIKDALVEMLLKLQEVDEMTAEIQARRRAARPLTVPLPDLVSGNISTEQIVKMLEEKVKVGMIASGQMGDGIDSGLSEDEEDAAIQPVEPPTKSEEPVQPSEMTERAPSPSITSFAIEEKPPAYPQVYSSLITGRSTGLVSASPGAGGGKMNRPKLCSIFLTFRFIYFRPVGAGSEEEADVPSRSFLKRQANLILDAKSRRKFRQAPATRRK